MRSLYRLKNLSAIMEASAVLSSILANDSLLALSAEFVQS